MHELLLSKINGMLDKFYDELELISLKENEKNTKNDLFEEKLNNLKLEYDKISNEILTKKGYFQRLYEDKINGVLDNDEYFMLKTKYKEDCDRLEERLSALEEEKKNTELKKSKMKSKENILKKYRNITQIDQEISDDFIDRIEIGRLNKENKTRDIKVIWNFTI